MASSTRTLLSYTWRERRREVLRTPTILFLVLFWVLFTQIRAGKSPFQDFTTGLNWWTEWLDPLIGVGVFLIALSVWFMKIRQDWEDSLEKRLTIRFHFEGREVMRCEEAYLAGENDIRSWGQQLGKQMSGSEQLKFEPFLMEREVPVIQYDMAWNTFYKLYESTVFLTERPASIGLSELQMKKFRFTEQKLVDGVIVWFRKMPVEMLEEAGPIQSPDET